MFRHNLLITLRSYRQQKHSFVINLFGLTAGLAGALLIFLWVQDERSFDGFHANTDRLYQVMEHQDYGDGIMTTTSTPGILSEALADEFPEFEFTATTSWIDQNTLSIEDKSLKVDGWHVGEDFFQMFTYPFVHGDAKTALSDKSSIVISRTLAERLFGDSSADVIGKVVEYEHAQSYIVSGVFQDIPDNSRYQFDYALSFEVFKDENEWVLSWGNNGPATYATLHPGTDPEAVSKKIAQFIHTKNEDSNVTLFLMNYKDRYLYGRLKDGQPDGGRIEYVRLFSVIALFILLIACINFMNLATARAGRRAKEIGIKKAIGAKKKSIYWQFLTESTFICFVSALFAIVIVWLFLPQFNEITDKDIQFNLDIGFIVGLLVLTMFTGFIAGSYPAFYLSRFAPAEAFKGQLKGSLAELWARKGLVIFQFSLSIILIIAVVVIGRQIDFVQNKNLGYDKDHVIVFEIEGKVETSLDPFLAQLKEIPGVVNASSIGHSLTGRNSNTSGISWPGKDPESRILFENVRVNYDLLETMDISMAQGRSFSREFADSNKIIVNEAALDIMGLKDPLGQQIQLWGDFQLEIIGIAKDFHFQSLHEPVNPLFFVINPQNTWNIMTRIHGSQQQQTLEEIKSFYASFNPGFAFDFEFLDEDYNEMYAAEQRIGTLSKYFAGMAILISCLGLLGLAIFSTERRSKEIGIRKVLGSSSFGIITLLTKDFTRMVIIAIFVALPAGFLLLRNWLDRFTYRIDLDWWLFAIAAFAALTIAWITVSTQALRAANIDPVKSIRSE